MKRILSRLPKSKYNLTFLGKGYSRCTSPETGKAPAVTLPLMVRLCERLSWELSYTRTGMGSRATSAPLRLPQPLRPPHTQTHVAWFRVQLLQESSPQYVTAKSYGYLN